MLLPAIALRSSGTMQRLCQTTRRCETSKNARMRSVATVAAWWRIEGDEELVSTSRQVSACRHWLALPWLSELGMRTASARAVGKDVAYRSDRCPYRGSPSG